VSWGSGEAKLTPDAAPHWLKPLTDNCRDVKQAYRRRVPPEVLALVTAANTKAANNVPTRCVPYLIRALS